MRHQKPSVVTDVVEVEVDGRPVQLVVAEPRGGESILPPPGQEIKATLSRVPAVRNLPRWEDGC